MKPSGMPTKIDSSSAPITICTVAGSRALIIDETVVGVNREVPRSPWTASLAHRPYCSGRESSRCSCPRISASRSGVALSPAITVAGSPGINLSRPNVSIDARISVGITVSRRLRMLQSTRSLRYCFRLTSVNFGLANRFGW